jgi:hypothetical protein
MISVLILSFCQVCTYLFSQIINIGCSFKFILKVDVEESIVNAPLVGLQSKNTNNPKSEVRFKQLIRDPWCVNNRLFNAYFEDKFKWTPDIFVLWQVNIFCVKTVFYFFYFSVSLSLS